MNDLGLLPVCEGFDWSGANAEKNWRKHHIAPLEAEQLFFNVPLVVAEDPKHSRHENRWYALGQTDEGRELFAAFTIRAARIRIISVRDMSRKERRIYKSS